MVYCGWMDSNETGEHKTVRAHIPAYAPLVVMRQQDREGWWVVNYPPYGSGVLV